MTNPVDEPRRATPDTQAMVIPDLPTNAIPIANMVLGGHYRLESRLGHGGMADVWRALDERLDRPVAIKLFRPEATHPQRERNEMRMLANLNHPGLVTVFDAGIADDSYGTAHSYIVMELVTGPTLSQQLDDGPLEPATVGLLGSQLASAFAYIHQRGIVHRDVKPANILLAAPIQPGRPYLGVKLTDFGIARMLDDTRLTEHGMTVGTPNYLSPEQVHGDELGPASDVYSLGLVLLECLTGQVVYPGHGIEAAVARLHRQPEVPAELGPAWSAALSPMLRLDPAGRPRAEQVAEALARVGEPNWASSAGIANPASDPTVVAVPDPADDPTVVAVPADLAATRVATPAAVVASPQPAPVSSSDVAWADSPVPWADNEEPAARKSGGGLGWLISAAVLLAVLVGMVLVITRSSGSHHSPTTPSYPTVTGRLGTDLSRLQKDVQP